MTWNDLKQRLRPSVEYVVVYAIGGAVLFAPVWWFTRRPIDDYIDFPDMRPYWAVALVLACTLPLALNRGSRTLAALLALGVPPIAVVIWYVYTIWSLANHARIVQWSETQLAEQLYFQVGVWVRLVGGPTVAGGIACLWYTFHQIGNRRTTI